MPCSWLWYDSHNWHIFVHSRFDYCNSIYYCPPQTQLNCLQHIQNALAHAVIAVSSSSNPDNILKSLHWLKVQKCTEYKVLTTMYKLLQFSFPCCLHKFITVWPSRSTQSSTLVTVLQPSPLVSRSQITLSGMHDAALHLWNKLPPSLHVP